MLPTLSHLNVNALPVGRLRLRCSSRSLRISLLHLEFHQPLKHSRFTVSNAIPELSSGLSHPTYKPVYVLFTPSYSEQRLHPPYCRGCWHGISRCFLYRYRQNKMVLTLCPFFPIERALQPKGLLHSRGIAASEFPPSWQWKLLGLSVVGAEGIPGVAVKCVDIGNSLCPYHTQAFQFPLP